MRILSISAQNFVSYKRIDFDFQNQGFTLIHGATGSGKSTLCDLIPWVLYGKTAKGGTVSEVLTWPGSEVTSATLIMADGYSYTRTRGSQPKDNDLIINDGERIYRGKDLLDTQKLINQELGMDYDLYLASSYYHEFSQTAQFFTTTAKNRRAICEQLVDLSLPKTLQVKAFEDWRTLVKQQTSLEQSIQGIAGKVSLLQRLQVSENTKAETWNQTHKANIEIAGRQYEAFEKNRKKTISKKCNYCNTVLQKPHEVIDTSENPFSNRLLDLEAASNPYTGTVKDYSTEITAQQSEETKLSIDLAQINSDITDLDILSGVITSFRMMSIENTIKDVETKTNDFLSKHFDAELRIEFDVTEADKLDVSIFKDGNQASYTQLSKGQRCILKLCFATAVMQAVANHHSITPSQIFYDEALDGLDGTMKEKAFHMLETLALNHESVFVVEHSESLKALFPNSFHVTLTNEGSKIENT